MKTNKKILFGLLVFLFICAVGIFFDHKKSMKEFPVLQGTYICNELPFASMVFDLNNNYTFYYYDNDVTDKGSYSKGTDHEYFINSSKFQNTKILYNGGDQTFTIMVDGENFLFKQIDRLPIINVEPEKK
jgi:hypothetical protein